MTDKEKRVIERSIKFTNNRIAKGKVNPSGVGDRIAESVYDMLGEIYDEYNAEIQKKKPDLQPKSDKSF